MNARIESTLGPVDVWAVCLVGPDDHRLLESAARLGLRNLLSSPSVADEAARRKRWDPRIAEAAGDLASECQQALNG